MLLFFSTEERQLFPLLATGLFVTGYALGRQLGKIQVFAMMEPSLPRLLALTGFHFTKVGETINFHGRRSAYYINKQQAESGLKLSRSSNEAEHLKSSTVTLVNFSKKNTSVSGYWKRSSKRSWPSCERRVTLAL